MPAIQGQHQQVAPAAAAPPAAGAAAAPYDAARDTAWKLQLWEAFEAAVGSQNPNSPRPIGCSGRLDNEPLPFLCPEVVVEDVGCLALPLTAAQSTELVAAAAVAPLAGGMSWQLEDQWGAGGLATSSACTVVVAGSRVNIGGDWQPVLQRAVAGAVSGLQLKPAAVDTMQACLRELVLRQGPCSARSLDQEGGAPGTIATLLVQLPCCGGCTGGGLEVKNLEQTFAYDLSQESDRGLHYTVHYSSCAQQQLGPLAAGRQLLLVYDLVWKGPPGTGPQPPGVSNPQQQLQAAAAAWEEAIAAGSMQLRLALPLSGTYAKHAQPVSVRWEPDYYMKQVNKYGPPLTIDQLQDVDKAAAAALAACPALQVTLLLLMRKVEGESGRVTSYTRHKRKQPWGFDRGPWKRPAGTERMLRWKPEPPASDEDDGVDWDKAVEEEAEARRAAKPEYYASSDSDAGVADELSYRWLGLDGSEADLGEFVAHRDFWHPAGRRLVWDLIRPHSERVEDNRDCYYADTGRRCSPSEESTRKYSRAFLVVTPRRYHHAAAAQGGPVAARKQVLPLMAVARDASRSLQEREAAAAQAACTLEYAAQSLRQALDPTYKRWQLELTDLRSLGPALSLVVAAARQVHAAQQPAANPLQEQEVPVGADQEAAAVGVPGLAALLAALSQLVSAVCRLPGMLGGVGGTHVGRTYTSNLAQLLEVIPLIGQEAVAAGMREAVAEVSRSNKELCLHAVKAAAAWPWVQQQMLGAMQAVATPREALQLLGSLPTLPDSQQQQVLGGLTQALQDDSTRADAVKAVCGAMPEWKSHPHLQAQVAAAVLEVMAHLPSASHYDVCCKLSWCGWTQWDPALQQLLLDTTRQAAAVWLGQPGQFQQQQQQQRLGTLCMRTQMLNKQLQQQVLEPRIAHIIGNPAVFAAQDAQDCLALTNLLLRPPHLMAALHQQFAAALLQRPDAQEVLEVLVAVGGMRHPQVWALPSVRQLLEARMAWLTQEQQRLAAGMQQQQLAVQMALQQRPWLGWTQPYALHSQPQLETFLRSNSSSMAMEQYKKPKAIRAALDRLCGTSPAVSMLVYHDDRQRPPALKGSVQTHTHSYQAEIVRQGNGRQQLVVRKTLCWLAPMAGRSREQLEHEMEDLQQLLQGAAGQQ